MIIRVVAKNYIKTDKVEEFITLAKRLVKETNEKDAGCISYELYQDVSNPQVLTILEEWDSMELLKKHMEAEHFKEITPLFKDYAEKPGEANLYKILA